MTVNKTHEEIKTHIACLNVLVEQMADELRKTKNDRDELALMLAHCEIGLERRKKK